jgi:hypothetical protein
VPLTLIEESRFTMTIADILGWVAVAFTLTAFSMRTMLPLRVAAIGANVFFMGYAHMEGMLPIFALHAILLPFNVVRLWQLLPEKSGAESHALQNLGPFDVAAMPILDFEGNTPSEPGTKIFRRTDGSFDIDHYDHTARNLRARDLCAGLKSMTTPIHWLLGASLRKPTQQTEQLRPQNNGLGETRHARST